MTTSYPKDDHALSSIRIQTGESRLRLFVGQGGCACCARQGEGRLQEDSEGFADANPTSCRVQ